MLMHFLIPVLLFISSPTSPGTLGASCKTQGHFTNAYLQIETGNLYCADSKWGWPEIKISEDATGSKVELSTSPVQKEKLNQFKSLLSLSNDPAIKDILAAITIGEKLLAAPKADYVTYKSFQENYINTIDKLSPQNKEKLATIFQELD